jgi:hypothetical protein
MDSQIVAGYRRLVLAIKNHGEETDNLLPMREYDVETVQNILKWLDFEFPDHAYGEILTKRFNLDGKGIWTLKKIGQQFGVSPERIRQKQKKALKLLRHPERGWRIVMFFRSALEDRIEYLENKNRQLEQDLAQERKHRMSEELRARFGDVSPDHVSIFDFELSVRLENCLRNNNVNTLGQVLIRTGDDFLRMKNFGRRSLNELKELISDYGLSLDKAK